MASLGIGFAFGARDEGMEGAMNNAEQHLDTLNGMLKDHGEEAEKAGKRTGHMLDMLRNLQLGGIAGQLNDLVGSSGNLTTSLEATFTALNKEAKPFSASLGLMGRDAAKMTGQIAGMAHSLNVGAQTVGEITVAMKTYGKAGAAALDAVGVSQKDLVKAQETGMIDAKEYLGTLSDMVKSWGQSEKAVGNLANEVIKMGQASGLGAEANKLLTKTISIADEVFAKTGRTLSEVEMQQMVRGVQATAAAFIELGDAPQVASEKAANVFKLMQEESEGQRAMMAGLGGDFGDVFLGLARDSGLGFKSVQDLFSLDPSDMISSLIKVQQTLQKRVESGAVGAEAQMVRFSNTVEKAGLTFALQSGPQTIEAMDKVKEAAKDATNAFKDTAKAGFSTGRTLQETFDLAKEGFIASFRSITRKSVRKDIKAQMKSFKSFAKTLKDTADEGGLMGAAIKKASAVSQLGLRGLFINLDKGEREASKFSAAMMLVSEGVLGVAGELQPLFVMLGPMIPMISGLASSFFAWPLALGAAAAGLVVFHEEIGEILDGVFAFLGGEEATTELGKKTKEWLEDSVVYAFEAWDFGMQATAKMLDKMKDVEWGKLGQSFGKNMAAVFAGEELPDDVVNLRTAAIGAQVENDVQASLDEAFGKLRGRTKKGKRYKKFGDELSESITSGISDAIQKGDVDREEAMQMMYERMLAEGIPKKTAEKLSANAADVLVNSMDKAGDEAVARSQMQKKMVEDFKATAQGIWEGFSAIIEETIFFPLFDLLREIGLLQEQLFYDFFVFPMQRFGDRMVETWENFTSGVKEKWNGFIEFVTGGADRFVSAFDPIVNFPETLSNMFSGEDGEGGIVGTLNGVGERFLTAGGAWVDNLIVGIKENWDEFMVWFKEQLSDPISLITGSEPDDKSSPWANLGERGKAFFGNMLDGMLEYQPTFIEGIKGILGASAIQGVQAMETALTEEMSLSFGRLGETFAAEMRVSASEAVDDFLSFAFNRAQDRIGMVSSAATNALASAIMELDDLASGRTLSTELKLKSSAEQTFIKEIRKQTATLFPQLKAINDATTLTARRVGAGGRGGREAPPVPNTGLTG